MKKIMLIVLLLSGNPALFAQDTAVAKEPPSAADADTIRTTAPASGYEIRIKQFIAPAAFIAAGSLLDGTGLKSWNERLKDKITQSSPGFKTRVDNVLQFAPGATVFGLQALGIKGKNTVGHEAILYAMALGINAALVTPLKHLTKVERPDGSSNLAYPSGHTSTAFASAEFLRREYKDLSPWYGVGGYIAATATGVLRMYKNRHWLGDVVAGAGFGIASTNLSYLIYNKLRIGTKKNKENKTTYFYPQVADHSYGLGFVKLLP
ncbi:MAG: phosphatase PAP2 family protein [Niabella sp.]|nr:phosphatase PAP2 family protein [Niabella sp.]